MRRAIAAAFALALLGSAGPTAPATAAPGTRQATASESAFCLANFDQRGDCSTVPVGDTIQEDDPWGRWDCKTMGNHVCNMPNKGLVIWFTIGGQLEGYELNAPDRPGCFVEPSNTAAGFEVIFYPDIADADGVGFEVRCP